MQFSRMAAPAVQEFKTEGTAFLPYGAAGIFNGASFVFFSFIGFDCVSTLAEEVKNPAVDMPVGIVGCISFVGIIYCLMSLCLVMMVPYSSLDPDASFATAFTQVGLPWGQYLVALGAVLGIVTGVLVGVMGVARIVTSMARTHLFFPQFGKISQRFHTPMWATAFVTVAGVPLAILTDLPPLIDMVSAGTLMVFAVVALALIWKRVIKTHAPVAENAKPLALVLLLTGVCIAFACIYGLCHGTPRVVGLAICGGLVLAFAAAIHLTCTQHDRPRYRVPLFPYLPAASLLLNCFLMASLPARAYWQLAIFFALMVVFYLLYSVHAANRFEHEVPAHGGVPVGTKAVDLEGGAAAAADSDAAAQKDADLQAGAQPVGSAGSITRSASLIERINTAPGSPRRSVLGRRSGGVTRLPPPTL